MKSFFYTFFTLLCISSTGFAQSSIGYFFDTKGDPILNHFQPDFYKPNKAWKMYMENTQFIQGEITNRKNETTQLLTRYRKEKLEIKRSRTGKPEKLKAKNFSSARIGLDSLFTIDQYKKLVYVRDYPHWMDKKGYEICQFYSHINDYDIAKITNQPTYIIKHTDSTEWNMIDISTKKDFKAFNNTYLSIYPELSSEIGWKKFSNRKLSDYIKTLEYYEAFKTQKHVYKDQYGNYVLNESESYYSCHVLKVDSGKWVLDYLHKGKPRLKMSYSSVSPLVKDGTCISYYESGEVHTEVFYNSEIKSSSTTFNLIGDTIYSFVRKVLDPYSSFPYPINYYSHIYGQKVNPRYNQNDSISIEDRKNRRKIYQVINSKKIVNSFFVEQGDTIYQPTNADINFKITDLQNLLIEKSNSNTFDSSIKHGAQGYSLLLLRVDNKGRLESYNTVYSSYSEHKRSLSHLFNLEAKNRFKIGKYRVNGKPVRYEVIVPINFVFINKIPDPKTNGTYYGPYTGGGQFGY